MEQFIQKWNSVINYSSLVFATLNTIMEENKLLNKVIIFVFFEHK